ncbi:FAD-dependent oxidoreductase [Phycicoccus sp.]|uniref:FAD-dependent oxidoreductase n=1 Tax=Phycicoccus sp. TaxID=1902410 RepID=UPI002C5EAE83|nr:FAD-dependent oxidoreductase [Phycicoccus sp.]HMM94999.1 FAD-dependent oxidoreductase [Phycicoccus sp.]
MRDQPVGVLVGSADGVRDALTHVQLVRQWSADVILFANRAFLAAVEREQLAARGIRVVDEGVVRLVVEDDRLAGVELADGRTVARTALFVRPTFVANDAILADLGCTTGPAGWVAVDPTGLTSVPGVWAAGNAVNPRAQVITAAGEGSAAAIAINNDLVDEDGRLALAAFRLGPTV